ncbi:MAG: GTPase ObgE [Candidatus Saccharimonadales bacterium]
MFVDEASIRVQAGKGGSGVASFRTEKFVSRGGPDGGDGGDGGNVVVRASNNVNTLAKFRHSKQIKAEAGESGRKRRAHGRNGEDVEIIVPVGTVIYEGDTAIADLVEVDATAILAHGGKGGFGNAHFVSSTRQAPRIAELGEPGEEKELRLELKSVADIGLVGLPNAGKSTLLSVISNARPEIADYPFTTLVPNLGVAEVYDEALIVADIPGLIEGASEGKGLGDDFLRHVERTKVLLHLIDAGSDDVVAAYQTIEKELNSYAIDLSHKPRLVALTKADAVPEEIVTAHQEQLRELTGEEVYVIASVAHQGLKEVLDAALTTVKSVAETEELEPTEDMPTLTLDDDPRSWSIEELDGEFTIHGEQLESFARRTDMNNSEGVDRLRDIMKKRGVNRELTRRGIQPGDKIRIGGKTLHW